MADPLTGAPLIAAVRRSVAERHDSGACHATPWVCSALDAILALCDTCAEFSWLPELGRDCIGNTNTAVLNHRLAVAEEALRAFLGAR